MKDPEKRAKKAAAAIALIRKTKSIFDWQEMVNLLREQGCPYAVYVPTILLKEKLVESHKGKYRFISDEPVYFKLIQKPLQEVSIKICSTKEHKRQLKGKDLTSKRIHATEVPRELITPKPASDAEVERAIALLKEYNYKILKPFTKYEEI